MKNEYKKSMCPFELEKDIAVKIGGKPKEINKQGQSALLVEVEKESQDTKIETVTTLLGKECSVKEYSFFNRKKGIDICVQQLGQHGQFPAGAKGGISHWRG